MSARPFTFRETCTQTQMHSSFISHASTGEAAPCQEIIAAESAGTVQNHYNPVLVFLNINVDVSHVLALPQKNVV